MKENIRKEPLNYCSKMKIYNYKGKRVFLQKAEYRNNGTLAALMCKEDGELYRTITVNLDSPLQSSELAFLDESHLPGIRRWLKKNKLGAFTGYESYTRSCTYPLYVLF